MNPIRGTTNSEPARAGSSSTPISAAVRANFDEAGLFLPQEVDSDALTAIVAVRETADQSGIAQHPFFGLATTSPNLLRLWVSQEAVVTGPFSELLLRVAADIHNVHLRASFLDVVVGEHGPVVDGLAADSHPYLLYRLSNSVGLRLAMVEPLECTINFLADIETLTNDPLSALGVLGVGNERLLVTEYAAVRACFAKSLPGADYADFLTSNIEEDFGHSAIAEKIAAALVSRGASLERYREASRLGVEARLHYYDDLVQFWDENGLPSHWLASARSQDLVTDTEKS